MSNLMTPVAGDPKITHTFWCPACECGHYIGPGWTSDGNLDAPTISPSILVRSGNAEGQTVCHMFVRAGMIEYLSDCTHALAGKTVPMVPWPEAPAAQNVMVRIEAWLSVGQTIVFEGESPGRVRVTAWGPTRPKDNASILSCAADEHLAEHVQSMLNELSGVTDNE